MRPDFTAKVCNPNLVDSVIISLNQKKAQSKIFIKLNNNQKELSLIVCIEYAKLVVNKNKLKATINGQGLGCMI